MSSIKDETINMIQSMPDNTNLEEIMAELYFMAQIDKGIEQLNSGKWITHEQVEKRMSKWLNK